MSCWTTVISRCSALSNSCLTLSTSWLADVTSTLSPTLRDTAPVSKRVHFAQEADDFVHRHLQGAQSLLRQSVTPATHTRYVRGWHQWVSFIGHAVAIPQPRDYLPAHLTPSQVTHLLLAFVSYLYSDLALTTHAIKMALSAVQFEFQANALDVHPFKDPLIESARRALVRVAPPVRRGKRIPFSLEMVLSFASYARNSGQLRHHMVAVGAQLGFFCVMRASEYLVTDSDKHTLRAKAVQFECEMPGTPQRVLVAAHAVRSVPFHRVHAVRVSSLTAKNIRPGEGQACWFSTTPDSPSGFCLARSLYDWACNAEFTGPDDHFLSLPLRSGLRAPLRYAAMSAAIGAVARQFGLDPRRCGTHSLRRGGATCLHAAGASSAMIMQAGRWRSAPVAATYPDRTSRSNDLQLRMLLSPDALSVRDIRMAQCLPETRVSSSRGSPSQRTHTS